MRMLFQLMLQLLLRLLLQLISLLPIHQPIQRIQASLPILHKGSVQQGRNLLYATSMVFSLWDTIERMSTTSLRATRTILLDSAIRPIPMPVLAMPNCHRREGKTSGPVLVGSVPMVALRVCRWIAEMLYTILSLLGLALLLIVTGVAMPVEHLLLVCQRLLLATLTRARNPLRLQRHQMKAASPAKHSLSY